MAKRRISTRPTLKYHNPYISRSLISYIVLDMSKKVVSKTKEELKYFKYYGDSDLIKMGGKYYTLHIPVPLYNLLGMEGKMKVKIYVNAESRDILLMLEPKPS